MNILKEARRLHAQKLAIHWLRPKSKIPVESGWTTGPRKKWSYLERTYQPGFNLGVRLGTPSSLATGFLAVVDVDIKSTDERHLREAITAAKTVIGKRPCPVVRSGRGMGSRHYYCVTRLPFKTYTPHRSTDTVRVHMPSKRPSQIELKTLSAKEIEKGIRLSAAWEVSLYSEGRQVVLPPSIHPDSGKEYRWSREWDSRALPLLVPDTLSRPVNSEKAGKNDAPQLEDFKVSPVELGWLDLSDNVRDGIMVGKGVTDRSAFLLKASTALFSAGLTENEVLTVLTDRTFFLSECAYEHAKTNSRKRAAQWLYRFTVRRVAAEKGSSAVFKEPPAPARTLTKEEIEAQSKDLEEDRHWSQDLIITKEGLTAKLLQNVFLVLSNSGAPPVVRRDEFCYRDFYTDNTPWGGKRGEVISDGDVDEAQLWLGKSYRFEPSKNLIESAFTIMARQNAHDPVKDFLDHLPKWDNVPRLDTWLADNFEAEGEPEYLAQVFRKWMVAMVMRVYRPGAKFDWMPIFEGAQGIGKSSFGRILVGDKYFLDWLPNLHDKDSALSLQGMWGVEMGELSQFRRNELETIKAFITRTVDKIRPPFGKRLIESARRCVFFGTTNRETYLIDETGNRRFKPVVVGNLDFKALRRERVQLFAEARYLFMEEIEREVTLELSGKAKIFERQIHQEKMVEDDSNSMEESMRNFMEKVEKKEAKFDFEKFKAIDLFEGCGPLAMWRKENRNLQFAAKMLRKMGAESRFIRGRKHWKMDNNENF